MDRNVFQEGIDPREIVPQVLPADWTVTALDDDGWPCLDRRDGLRVIVTASREQDGRRWLHVSCSRRTRLPDWQDVKDMKDLFIGHDQVAMQVLPATKDFVNIHPRCLHLWSCLDGWPLPDFTTGGQTI